MALLPDVEVPAGLPVHVVRGRASDVDALERALAEPGLLVLGDLPLWDAWWARCGGDVDAFVDELCVDHGPERRAAWRRMLQDSPKPEGWQTFWLTRRLVESSLVTCTFGAAAAAELRRRHPAADVRTLPLVGTAGPRDPDAIAVLADDEHAVLASEVREALQHKGFRLADDGATVVSLRTALTGTPDRPLLDALASGAAVIALDSPAARDHGAGNVLRVVPAATEVVAAVETADRGRLGAAAALWARRHARPEQLETAVAQALSDAAAMPRPTTAVVDRHEPGLDALGDAAVASGLGEAAASLVDALHRAEVPLTFRELAYVGGEVAATRRAVSDGLPAGPSHGRTLLLYNVHAMPNLDDALLDELTGDSYRIGYWLYEMPTIPERLRPQLDRVDEIWTTAEYDADAFRAAMPSMHVHVVPCAVDVPVSPGASRRWFGLPEDRTIFLVSFAATSCDARKNPWGAIEAFRRAFPRVGEPGSPLLVVKAHHLRRVPKLQRDLTLAVESVGGVLITDEMTRQETNDLHALADCYVSLHRAEGFGLGVAESMHLGKPVITTAYSSTMDWTTRDNCFLVPAGLTPVTVEQLRYQPHFAAVYPPGEPWAEPEVGFAAQHMRTVVEDPARTAEIARQGAIDVRAHTSPAAVAAVVRARLAELDRLGLRSTRRQLSPL